mmetsp:Transcript_112675/g.329278  ORF Transcript_112675/g.329278 Transcript_112675/m.329278 type:complete len:208 (+) Transcript_112675:1173-1796(+)
MPKLSSRNVLISAFTLYPCQVGYRAKPRTRRKIWKSSRRQRALLNARSGPSLFTLSQARSMAARVALREKSKSPPVLADSLPAPCTSPTCTPNTRLTVATSLSGRLELAGAGGGVGAGGGAGPAGLGTGCCGVDDGTSSTWLKLSKPGPLRRRLWNSPFATALANRSKSASPTPELTATETTRPPAPSSLRPLPPPPRSTSSGEIPR